MVPTIENAVPSAPHQEPPHPEYEDLALRSLGDRYTTYADEVQRLRRAGLAVMRRTQSINPKVSDVVREAGLSNQAFYRHFRGKDELLLAILDDGARQLVDYLTHLMDKEAQPVAKIRRWVAGIMAQAADPAAADATRPFVVESLRLAAQFPEQSTRSEERLRAPLREAIAQASELSEADATRDAEAVYHLAMGTMHGYLVRGETPSPAEIDRLCDFVVAGLARATRKGGRRGA
jgi:AcrR family transcriptional regulator